MIALAAGTILAACSSDNSTGPDARNCTKGTITAPDTKTGKLGSTSCLRWDYAYASPLTGDSVYSDSWDVSLVKGQGYVFNLQNVADSDWDAVLELVGTNPTTGDVDLLSISDDEGVRGTKWAQMFFIAPASGTYSLRVSGYDVGDTVSYSLTSKRCDPAMPTIADSLVTTSQQLTAFDCVLEQPLFAQFGTHESTYVKLYSVHFNPNDTKRITVTFGDFFPAFQIVGPDWGVYCYYDYQGCGENFTTAGGSVVLPGGSSSISLDLTTDGRFTCQWDFCGYTHFPGDYTLVVGAENFGDVGAFQLTVLPIVLDDIVGSQAFAHKSNAIPAFNPVLNHLRVKPQRALAGFRKVKTQH
jgi:hypothetical protein